MVTALSYIESGMPVEGFFAPLDARLMLAVDDLQREVGTTGDLLEIGAYLGKTAILLGYFARGSERLHVVDPFEDPPPTAEAQREHARWYVGLTRDRFLANYRGFHAIQPVIHQGRSDEQLPGLEEKAYRFIHVDGSHSYDAVLADAAQTRRIAGAGAIVIFDDMTTRHTPGVAAAVWDAVLHHGLRPLAFTNKLYATWDPDIDRREITRRAVGIAVVDEHNVAGHMVAEIVEIPEAVTTIRRFARAVLPPAVASVAHRAIGR